MPTVEDYAKQPFEARLARLTRTPDELAAAIHDQTDAVLARHPDEKNWAAKEVVCLLRDAEEVFFVRFHLIVENDEPKMYFDPGAAERFANDRQYSWSDGREALAAFRRKRGETVVFSAYELADSTRVWIITEADRSVTTILLPEEY